MKWGDRGNDDENKDYMVSNDSFFKARDIITGIDTELLEILSHRMSFFDLSQEALNNSFSPLDFNCRIIEKARKRTLSFEFALKVFSVIAEYSDVPQSESINIIDDRIIELLYVRMQQSKIIGQYKKERKLPIQDLVQWKKVCDRIIEQAKEKGLQEDYVRQLYKIIHTYSKQIQI